MFRSKSFKLYAILWCQFLMLRVKQLATITANQCITAQAN